MHFTEWELKLSFSKISLKFVLGIPTGNKSALVQVMAWHQSGARPLPEPNDDLVQDPNVSPSLNVLTLKVSGYLQWILIHIWHLLTPLLHHNQ